MVDTIGLDMAGSHSLSKLINGAYMSGDDPQSLTEAVSKAVAEIGFGDGRDTSEDAFEEIGEIPESFAMATTLGLTTYSNQPIGQHAPESIDASRSSNQPTTTTGSNTGLGGIGAVWVSIAILAFGILWVLSLLKKVRNHHGR